MGRDIDIIIEYKPENTNTWNCVFSSIHISHNLDILDRYYHFFSYLVKLHHKGIPSDANTFTGTALLHELENGSHHFSFMSAKEFIEIYLHVLQQPQLLKMDFTKIEKLAKYPQQLLGLTENINDYRVIFWFTD